MSDSLQPRGLQHARPPCPSPTPGVYSNSCPLSQWCHPTISSSVVPFSSCLQSFPASGSFQMSQLFESDGQSIGVSASTSVLPMYFQDWFPLGSKITADGDSSHAIKRCLLLGRKVMTNLDSILKSRHYFANKGPSSQGCGFSSSRVWMWELDYKESWEPKNWCFWTVMLEKTLESPLDCRGTQPVHPKASIWWRVFTSAKQVRKCASDSYLFYSTSEKS